MEKSVNYGQLALIMMKKFYRIGPRPAWHAHSTCWAELLRLMKAHGQNCQTNSWAQNQLRSYALDCQSEFPGQTKNIATKQT